MGVAGRTGVEPMGPYVRRVARSERSAERFSPAAPGRRPGPGAPPPVMRPARGLSAARRARRRWRGGSGCGSRARAVPRARPRSACESGHVASEWGKSFAHMSRRSFMRSTVRNATQSSWNVRYTCSRNVSLGRWVELAGGEPVAMTVVGVVGAVHPVRRPAGVGLDAHDAQLGVALEHRAEDQGADDVLVPADDRQERVELRPADADPRPGVSLRLVRMWNDGGSSSSIERVPEVVVHGSS